MAKATIKMVMKQADVTVRLKLLKMWDYQCVICGHSFHDISSVTFEHIVPKSLGGKKNKKKRLNSDFFAPSHFNCNQFRENFSLLKAMRLLNRRKKQVGELEFFRWINKAVPNRIIAPELMATHTGRPLQCFELPERLPGLP